MEKELLSGDAEAETAGPETLSVPARAWRAYSNGTPYLQHLAAGGSPKAVLTALQGFGTAGWPELVATAVATVRSSGRGAVVVVPDYRDLDRLEAALAKLFCRRRTSPVSPLTTARLRGTETSSGS